MGASSARVGPRSGAPCCSLPCCSAPCCPPACSSPVRRCSSDAFRLVQVGRRTAVDPKLPNELLAWRASLAPNRRSPLPWRWRRLGSVVRPAEPPSCPGANEDRFMPSTRDKCLHDARELLRAGHRGEAIEAYEAHVRSHDGDVEAWLELGLASLVSGSQARFAEIHAMFRPCLEDAKIREAAGERVQILWAQMAAVVSRCLRATALGAALVLSGSLAACSEDAASAPTPDAQAAASVGEAASAQPASSASAASSSSAATMPETRASSSASGGPLDGGSPPADAAAVRPTASSKPTATAPPRHTGPRTRYVAVHFDDRSF